VEEEEEEEEEEVTTVVVGIVHVQHAPRPAVVRTMKWCMA
jgi:hypothetical protein